MQVFIYQCSSLGSSYSVNTHVADFLTCLFLFVRLSLRLRLDFLASLHLLFSLLLLLNTYFSYCLVLYHYYPSAYFYKRACLYVRRTFLLLNAVLHPLPCSVFYNRTNFLYICCFILLCNDLLFCFLTY
jgi:hypothetical protein